MINNFNIFKGKGQTNYTKTYKKNRHASKRRKTNRLHEMQRNVDSITENLTAKRKYCILCSVYNWNRTKNITEKNLPKLITDNEPWPNFKTQIY